MTTELEQLKSENASLKKLLADLEHTSKMLVHRDIDLRQAYNDLKRLDKEKSEFVSIAAHQLRTPLTSVHFANQMLTDSVAASLSESQQKVLTQARASIDRMFAMIEDLLVVDALDYGGLKFILVPLRLESIIAEVVASLQTAADKKSLVVTTEFAQESKDIQADARRLKEALSNVIDNAIKYTPDGGKITIATRYQDGQAIVSIADTGIGVADSDAPSLFKKFSRFDNAKKVDANGSGLGLYISKKIIEQHGGTIAYEPHVPQGASFVLRFSL